jgi:uncharacterized protein (UPF0332 family)
MKRQPFDQTLLRKSHRALQSARIALAKGDYDGAVNRCYYAMFDMTRAALLRGGLAEDKLPRTHSGVIEAFRNQAVNTGKLDGDMVSELSRTESLRIKADDSGEEIDRETAAKAVSRAEVFMQTVESTYGLDTPDPGRGGQVSEPGSAAEESINRRTDPRSFDLEEERRKARENWLKMRQQSAQQMAQQRDNSGISPGLSEDRDRDRGLSLDDELP